MDPFAVLGINRGFDVDLGAVEKLHRALSRALHPDRYAGASASERRAALQKAASVNEAWRIVRDPIRRAEALLGLAGEEAHPGGADQEFLMEMLERREALAEAKAERDLGRVRELARAVEERSRACERDLAAGFARGETAMLARKVGELRFYRRFLDEVSAIEDELAA